MSLSIKKFLEQYGVITEMNDWKTHFLAGTKGQKKTDKSILDYVENLLSTVFSDKEKVKNNKLAPWLVEKIREIGVGNIGTDDRNKLLNIIDWTKEINGVANIPKLTISQAQDYVVSAREKKSKEVKPNNTGGPVSAIPETEDEKKKFIKRVYVLPDGSGRMWVKILNHTWLNNQCKAGKSQGIGCQIGGGWEDSTIYTLIGPPKGEPSGIQSTIASMAVSPDTKAITELRQEGNQQPGRQATSGGWNDIAEQAINFIAVSPEGRQNIKSFNMYGGQKPGLVADSEHNPYGDSPGGGGGAGTLWYIMNNKPELLNKLVLSRPEMKEDNKNIILSHYKFGKKWYQTFGTDIEKYAKENPVKFIEDLETYEFLGSKLGEILQKINIDAVAASHPKLVISKIDKLLGSLPVDTFKKLLNTINLTQYIKTSTDQFKNLVKMMSAAKDPKYKELMSEMVSKNINTIMDASGGGIKGLYDFLDFTAMPKMHRFSRKDTDGQIYAYKKITVVDPATGDRTITEEEFPLRDDLMILPQKERRKIIENNKVAIKSLFKGTDEEKEIKFLRVLFKETNPQDVERTLKADKDRFIKYYDKHPSNTTGYPGILEFYSVIDKNKPGYTTVVQTHGEANRVYYKMDAEDLRNRDFQKRLIGYFFSKSQAANSNTKKYDAAADFLRTMQASGESPESIMEMAKKEFSPKQVISKTPTSADYSLFISVMHKILSASDLKKFIEFYRDEIIASGMMGSETYKDMLQRYAERGYNVKVGDMVMYNKHMPENYSSEDDDGIFLTRGLKYKVADTQDTKDLKNAMIEVYNDRVINGQREKSWHNSSDFALKVVNLQESVRKYVLKKIIETYEKNIMETKVTKPNYSAVVLDEDSRAKIILRFRIPTGWELIADHMTIKLGELSDKSILGKEFIMKATHIASDDKVMALQVETDAPSNKSIKHITLAVNREDGGKPAMSNNLTDWQPLKTPLILKGIVEEVKTINKTL